MSSAAGGLKSVAASSASRAPRSSKPAPTGVVGELRAWYQGRQRHCEALALMEERCADVVGALSALQAMDSLTAEQQRQLASSATECEALRARAADQRLRFLQPNGEGGLQPGARVGVFGLENAGKSTFLSAWAAHNKKFLPADDERCTGTSCRVHHRPINESSQQRFSAKVTFRSKEQFLPLVHDLCKQLDIAHDDIVSMSPATASALQTRVAAYTKPSNVALDELRNITKNWTTITQVISSDNTQHASTQVIHCDDPQEFAKRIRPFIHLTGPYPRAVLFVDIYASLTGLDEGIELLDLPGINSPHPEVNRVTFDSLSSLDLVLFLHDATVPQLTGDGQISLQKLISEKRKVLFLATGIDKPVCLTPTEDEETGRPKPHTPVRVVRNVRTLFPSLPLSDIHAVSSYWYCDNRSLEAEVQTHPMVQELRTELQTGAFPADGIARLIDRIRRWCDVDLAMNDAEAVDQLAEAERVMWDGIRSIRQSLHVVDAGAALASREVALLITGYNSRDPDCLYGCLVSALNETINLQQDRLDDASRLSKLLSHIHEVMENSFSSESVRTRLQLMVNQSSIGQPFCLADLEMVLRRTAFQAVDSSISVMLEKEHNAMVNDMMQHYINNYCAATWKNGCINNLLLDCSEETVEAREQLRAHLDAAQTVAHSAGIPWISKVKEILHLIVGVAPGDHSRREYVRSTVELPNCSHKASKVGSLFKLTNPSWQLEHLFFLPWVVRGLEVDKQPFTSASFVVDKLRDWDQMVNAEHVQKICMEVYQRLQSAVQHLIEMVSYVVGDGRLLASSRRACLTSLQFELLTQQQGAGRWLSICSVLLNAPTPILFPATQASQAVAEQRKKTAAALVKLLQIEGTR